VLPCAVPGTLYSFLLPNIPSIIYAAFMARIARKNRGQNPVPTKYDFESVLMKASLAGLLKRKKATGKYCEESLTGDRC
jgi:hypothetical protein